MISACTNTPTTVVEKTPDQVPEVPIAEKVALENFKQKIVQVPYNPTMVDANVAP